MGDLLKKRCDDLGPPVMLPHQETMIGIHKQQRIRPEIIFIKRIKHPAQLLIAEGDQGGIEITDMCHSLLIFPYLPVWRPVERRAIIFMRIEVLELLLRKERFMGIERFNLQVPPISILVTLDEFQPRAERTMLRLQLRLVHVLPVDVVLPLE